MIFKKYLFTYYLPKVPDDIPKHIYLPEAYEVPSNTQKKD